ncbi:uncharacterized protein LOC110453803 [Mizuhopecten yessoensis]|uniref:uncharacterized protein LOC110453803 n=1 Tax=Mizuhopecten yessoensis TaxID=6573 RepID=UPI000B457734|nr:uncharacterized protein LOC110453803 [Mizuhopecten yessoensis]
MVRHRFPWCLESTCPSVIATLTLGLLIPNVLSQTNFESRPLWGTGRGRPAGKTCLNYCQLLPICNHGKCFLDQSSCDVICACEEGYTGKWCKEQATKVGPRTGNNTQPVPPIGKPWESPAHSAPKGPTKRPLMILGTFRPRNGNKKSPPFIFPMMPANPPSNKQPQRSDDIAEREETKAINNSSNNVKSNARQLVLPNSTTMTIIRTKLEDMDNVTSIDIESANSAIKELPNKDTIPTTSVDELVHPTESVITSPGTLDSTQGEVLSTVEPMSSQRVCEESCHTGKCLFNGGEYRCVKESAPIIMATIENASMAARGECGKGFKCRHGVCDPDQLRKGRIKCICDKGWIGTLCEHACELDCGEHGMCGHPDKNKTSMVCLCNTGYDGDRCQDVKILPEFNKDVEDPSVHIYVIGFTIGFVVFFTLILILITYCLWRRRFVFIMKIVHYFQHYEENDGQIYDAFVSYKSSKEDEHFVLTKLYPKLEMELGFKMCMHFRDFTPGEAIANNIISAIERSRRTIMILSPNYINSEWCRMEYQKAQHEMLKMRHKIIPIVLEDVSKCKTMDKNLKTILSTVTYIEWPGEEDPKKLEKFWKKIELSLPKKRSGEHSPSNSVESTSTSSSTTSNDIDVSKSSSEDPASNTILSTITDSVSITMDKCDPKKSSQQGSDTPGKARSETRLKKMKDVLKLKINNNNNRALCREISIESNISTPVSSTPSPGFFGGKDSTPLLSKKLLNCKQINKSSAKSSTWSHRNHNRGRKNSQTQSQSFTEKDVNRPCLDVIPQTPTSPSPNDVDLPDVCRTAGYYNIVCGEKTSPSTENDFAGMQQCPTCILRKDDVDANSTINSLAEQVKGQQQNNLGNPTGLNISLDHIRSPYPTSVYSYDNTGESVDVTNTSVTSKVITKCSTCALRVNVDNVYQERETQFTSDLNTDDSLSSGERRNNTNFIKDVNCESDEKISNIQPNENPLLNVLHLPIQGRYIPNFHVNNAFIENEENKPPIPIPPIRVKKLQRQNSRENL